MKDTKSKTRTMITHYPEEIECFKCRHSMERGNRYWGESSNIWPIGQSYHCGFCRENVGITQDGRVTHWTGKVIGYFSATGELTWSEGVRVKQIWELTETEVDELLANPPEFTADTERLLCDLSTYYFITQERSKEVAEKWRQWLGQMKRVGLVTPPQGALEW